MYTKRILTVIFCSLLFFKTNAQINEPITEADMHSLSLYNSAQWKDLLAYGKERIASGIDFPLLRMRIGYAAFMLKNYSRSLQQYQKVWNLDHSNNAALYYVYLNNIYLNNTISAKYYAAKLSVETKEQEAVKGSKVSGVQVEFSNKMPDDTSRRSAQYVRSGINIDLGYRVLLQQSLAYYTLLVNTPIPNNRVIYRRLQQPEYYAKLNYAVTGQVSLFGAYHFISDRFPDTVLNTNVFLGGIKYCTPYVIIQADAGFGNFATNYSQYDGILTVYPLGNLNLYSISRISVGTQTNFTQVLGTKISNAIWLEGNITSGRENYLFENDALYVKNDPDPILFKCGGSMYAVLSKKLMLSLNYIFEQKQKQLNIPNNIYYQHSINGGLTWKF